MKPSDLIPGRASRRRREEEVRLLRTRMAQLKSGWPNNQEDYELGDVIGTYYLLKIYCRFILTL